MHPDAWLVVLDPQRIFASAAAHAGATVTVVTDACTGSTPQNHRTARLFHSNQALVDVVIEVPDLPAPGLGTAPTITADDDLLARHPA